MERVVHDGRRTAYREPSFGGKPAVLYVHGAGGSHQVWTRQYGDRQRPPGVAVDLSGHGDSDDIDAAAGRETLEAYADDVVAVAEETGARVLCGNSMGGAVSLWVALERDRPIEGLVLCDTGSTLGVAPEFLELLSLDFPAAVEYLHEPGRLFHEPDEDLVAASEAAFLASGPAVTRRDFETCNLFDVRERLDEIRTPAVAVCGEHDSLTPPSFSEYLAAELPECECVVLEDAGHLPMLERPKRFGEVLEDFLTDR